MQQLTHEQRALADAALAQRMNVIHHAYVDICGDLVAGALLGQILYWFGADRNGNTRARIQRDGKTWIAKARGDWHDEIRITPKQYDRAIKILKNKKFVEVGTFKFAGNPTTHITIIAEEINNAIDRWKADYIAAMQDESEPRTLVPVGYSPLGNNDITQSESPLLTFGEQPSLPIGNNDIDQSGISSYTEITYRDFDRDHAHISESAGDSANAAINHHLKQKDELERAFERAWEEYPKKEGKTKARSAFLKAIRGMGTRKPNGEPYTADEIRVEAILYRHHVEKAMEAGEMTYRYIPTGAAWFEREGWADTYPSISSKFDDYMVGVQYNRATARMRQIAAEIGKADAAERYKLGVELEEIIFNLPV